MLLPIKSRPLRRGELCWLILFLLICFVQKSLCQDDLGPSVKEETVIILLNRTIYRIKAFLDSNFRLGFQTLNDYLFNLAVAGTQEIFEQHLVKNEEQLSFSKRYSAHFGEVSSM